MVMSHDGAAMRRERTRLRIGWDRESEMGAEGFSVTPGDKVDRVKKKRLGQGREERLGNEEGGTFVGLDSAGKYK